MNTRQQTELINLVGTVKAILTDERFHDESQVTDIEGLIEQGYKALDELEAPWAEYAELTRLSNIYYDR